MPALPTCTLRLCRFHAPPYKIGMSFYLYFECYDFFSLFRSTTTGTCTSSMTTTTRRCSISIGVTFVERFLSTSPTLRLVEAHSHHEHLTQDVVVTDKCVSASIVNSLIFCTAPVFHKWMPHSYVVWMRLKNDTSVWPNVWIKVAQICPKRLNLKISQKSQISRTVILFF